MAKGIHGGRKQPRATGPRRRKTLGRAEGLRRLNQWARKREISPRLETIWRRRAAVDTSNETRDEIREVVRLLVQAESRALEKLGDVFPAARWLDWLEDVKPVSRRYRIIENAQSRFGMPGYVQPPGKAGTRQRFLSLREIARWLHKEHLPAVAEQQAALEAAGEDGFGGKPSPATERYWGAKADREEMARDREAGRLLDAGQVVDYMTTIGQGFQAAALLIQQEHGDPAYRILLDAIERMESETQKMLGDGKKGTPDRG